jgi:exopolysaccharide production protein ExoQ
MSQALSALFALLIIWLLVMDWKVRPMPSRSLYIPLAWMLIIGGRNISSWTLTPVEMDSPEELLAGSPVDRNTLLILIILGAVALYRRKPAWRTIVSGNRWFFAFFIYCGLSALWSDLPFVSLKRWTKELGNVIMVLILLSENDPGRAVRAALSRYCHLVIPLSLFLIYCYPDLGVYLDEDKMVPSYGGVATNKNSLGSLICVSGVYLVWEYLYARAASSSWRDKADLCGGLAMLLMVGWLMYLAESATALVCLLLGVALLLVLRIPFFRRQARHLGCYALALGLIVVGLLGSAPEFLNTFTGGVGRDATFTGRTDIWADVLEERTNPLIGTGYQSFWLGERAEYYWEAYPFHIKEAHNGYLETYLTGGFLGLSLLAALAVAVVAKLKGALRQRDDFAVLLLAFFITTLLRNCTESNISNLSISWFVLCFAGLYLPGGQPEPAPLPAYPPILPRKKPAQS